MFIGEDSCGWGNRDGGGLEERGGGRGNSNPRGMSFFFGFCEFCFLGRGEERGGGS